MPQALTNRRQCNLAYDFPVSREEITSCNLDTAAGCLGSAGRVADWVEWFLLEVRLVNL